MQGAKAEGDRSVLGYSCPSLNAETGATVRTFDTPPYLRRVTVKSLSSSPKTSLPSFASQPIAR